MSTHLIPVVCVVYAKAYLVYFVFCVLSSWSDLPVLWMCLAVAYSVVAQNSRRQSRVPHHTSLTYFFRLLEQIRSLAANTFFVVPILTTNCIVLAEAVLALVELIFHFQN